LLNVRTNYQIWPITKHTNLSYENNHSELKQKHETGQARENMQLREVGYQVQETIKPVPSARERTTVGKRETVRRHATVTTRGKTCNLFSQARENMHSVLRTVLGAENMQPVRSAGKRA